MEDFCVNVDLVPLRPRNLPESIIKHGSPQVSGRVLSVGQDKRTARVVWQSTPGTLAMPANPDVIDVSYVVSGQAIIRVEAEPHVVLEPGVVVEFPRTAYELEIIGTLKKVSFLYAPNGLKLEAEPERI